MIQIVVIYHCTKCNSTNMNKNGTDYKGDQKFHCLDERVAKLTQKSGMRCFL